MASCTEGFDPPDLCEAQALLGARADAEQATPSSHRRPERRQPRGAVWYDQSSKGYIWA